VFTSLCLPLHESVFEGNYKNIISNKGSFPVMSSNAKSQSPRHNFMVQYEVFPSTCQ
jgi:hypothetical protein